MKLQKVVLFLFVFGGFSSLGWTQEERGTRVEKIIPKDTGQTWALIVGVSQYQFINSLRFASDDAFAFYNYLLSPAGGSIPQVNIQFLTNEKATLGQLDRALGNLLDFVKPNDRVFLYFAGRRIKNPKTIAQRGFLLTNDTFSSNYNSTAFPVIYLKIILPHFLPKIERKYLYFWTLAIREIGRK